MQQTVVKRKAAVAKQIKESIVATPLAVVLMFFLTVVGWMIFRETDISRLVWMFQQSPLVSTPEQWLAASVMFGVVIFCAIPLITALLVEKYMVPRIEKKPILDIFSFKNKYPITAKKIV